jgi:two-component system, OmpR family, alkaline phosphatase synthesis response regulator PhoP
LSQVWEYQSSISTRTVDVHMAWLRQKLEDNPQYPKYLTTVRGFGYRFAGQ